MLTVDILTMDMHSVHGANRVTEKLIKGREIFESSGFHLRYVVSQDGIIDCWKYNNSTLGIGLESNNYQHKRKIIELLKKLFIYNTYFVQKGIVNKLFTDNQKVVDFYTKGIVSNGLAIDKRADIIIFQDPFTAQFYLQKTKDYGKSIFISHAAQDPLEQLLLNRPSLKNTKYEQWLRDNYKFMADHVNKVVTICNTAQRFNKAEYNRDCPCIMNGIEDIKIENPKKYSISDGKIHIAILASVQYRKGQDIAIDALLKLRDDEKTKIFLDIMGTGSGLEPLQEKVAKSGLTDCVKFYGAVLDAEKKLPLEDVFLLPSRADTVPIAILEAMRASLPIFATSVGEIPEMIAGCGNLIESSVDSVACLYRDLIEKKYNIFELGNKSREKFLKEYNLPIMIQKYCTVLNEIVSLK